MLIKFESGDAEEIHKTLSQKLKTTYTKNGCEYHTIFSKEADSSSLKSYDFRNGVTCNILRGNISPRIQLEFVEGSRNCLRYIFIKKGTLVQTLSPNIRYHLENFASCIVAGKDGNNQLYTLPIQKNVEILCLQIETKQFSIDLKSDFFNLPKEKNNNLMNKETERYFIHQGHYTLSISDTINEILKTQKEGIVKRFFLESKALELLWQQTELYHQELRTGGRQKVIRKSDILVIKKAKDYIHENLNKKLTLASVSKEIGTNETKLKNGFKKLYGKSFTEILRTERLNKAKMLLDEGQSSIKEIANSCGYESISMFSTRFKERFGESPGKYLNS